MSDKTIIRAYILFAVLIIGWNFKEGRKLLQRVGTFELLQSPEPPRRYARVHGRNKKNKTYVSSSLLGSDLSPATRAFWRTYRRVIDGHRTLKDLYIAREDVFSALRSDEVSQVNSGKQNRKRYYDTATRIAEAYKRAENAVRKAALQGPLSALALQNSAFLNV